MIQRVLLWVVVLSIGFGIHAAYKHWSNPWKSVTPISSVLPAAYDGCGSNCKK